MPMDGFTSIPEPTGPRIYNLFPLLAGPMTAWGSHLPRIAAMGFDWVYVNPFHYPGFSGSIYAVKDYDRLHPLIEGDGTMPQELLVRRFIDEARAHGLLVMMDLVVNHTSKDSLLAEAHPEWFVHEPDGSLRSPRVVDPADGRSVTVWGDLAELDYETKDTRRALAETWGELVARYVDWGISGFRCDAAYKVPSDLWADLIARTRGRNSSVVFSAETLGCTIEQVSSLADAGFDYLFNSVKWWDLRAPWALEQYERYRAIAPSIGFPESHDTERLATELEGQGVTDPTDIAAIYRQRYALAACFGAGVMMPMGYEFGFRKKLNVVLTRPDDWEEPLFDLTADIAAINRAKAANRALNEEGPQARAEQGSLVALGRRSADGTTGSLFVTNMAGAPMTADLAALRDQLGLPTGDLVDLMRPFGTRLDQAEISAHGWRILGTRMAMAANAAQEMPPEWSAEARILIEDVWPSIDGGRFPIKRVVGDRVTVWADILRDGHDVLAARVIWREPGESAWREAAMEHRDNDRWAGHVELRRTGRTAMSIEAWADVYGTWIRDLAKRSEAGQDLTLEIGEGRQMLEATRLGVDGVARARVEQAIGALERGLEGAGLVAALSDPALRETMRSAGPRRDVTRLARELEIVVDRPAAAYAAWYEMFPRSQGRQPGRGATFDDCIARLPEVARMGFDVVYLVPIHPIGRTNRKGPNNALRAGPGDPGSPYAIGGAEGGHTEVHPELGTLEDFRRFVAAARGHGMEVALDFAIQASPDHPWIRDHPDWFLWRADGTIRHAENPPKKYQDIVNVEFYGPHRDALWHELRDVVLFWVAQGVRTFRVDNPHTKPLPFWEWLIRTVQTRHPDVVFLAEAFTRPKMMRALAKLGFTQSYTYFTWRTEKREIAEYLTELTRSAMREYFRPNFFVNTPDILPPILQTGGPPAFKQRAVLAALLSGVWGMYNGYELCEGRAVPGTEEYLHSEKYEHKVWDWDRPGHIKDYITRLNAIRRAHPFVADPESLVFLETTSDNVLGFMRIAPNGAALIVLVNLDPHRTHETTISLPLERLGIGEREGFEVVDEATGKAATWRGRHHGMRIDPKADPARIYSHSPSGREHAVGEREISHAIAVPEVEHAPIGIEKVET
jgi:starch synthase (maltosyl-transferring)